MLARVLAAVVAVVVVVLLGAAPAGAHTGFESSDPADGAVVEGPVTSITLVFSGEAAPAGDGFEVLDASGVVHTPEASTEDGLVWVLTLDAPLAAGPVGVRWMVAAPDAHPINGAFSFTNERGAEPAPGATSTGSNDNADGVAAVREGSVADEAGTATSLESFLDEGETVSTATAERAGAAGRTISMLGALVAIGALAFAWLVLRGHPSEVIQPLFWARRGAVAVGLGGLVELVALAALGAGGSLPANPSTWWTAVSSEAGLAVAARLLGASVLTIGLPLSVIAASERFDLVGSVRGTSIDDERDGWPAAAWPTPSDDLDAATDSAPVSVADPEPVVWDPAQPAIGWVVVGALLLVGSYSLDGHTVTEGPRLVTALADAAHVVGGAVWTGGVVMIAAVLWHRHRSGRELQAAELATRFSVVATGAVVLVGAAGVALTAIILDSPAELWSTPWGRLLLVKVLLVALAGGLGAYNHFVLEPALHDDRSFGTQFRWVVTTEALLLLGVVATTAWLVGAAS